MKVAYRFSTDELRDRLSAMALLVRRRPRALSGDPPDSRPIVPPQTVSGRALAIVVGIMAFLASLAAGGVTLVSSASVSWQGDIVREVTIQVKPIEEVDVHAETEKAAALALAAPGIATVRVLDDSEDAKLLEPWLGTGFDIGDLPLPRLVVVEIGDPGRVDLAALAKRLRSDVRGATLDDHRAWTDRLKTMANAAVVIGLAILFLVFVVTVLCVVFATRGAMAGNRDIVSVLHFVGAEDSFIAKEFQSHFLLLGLKGGLSGAVGAAVFFAGLSLLAAWSLAGPEGETVAFLLGRLSIGPIGYVSAFAVALAIAAMTAVTSRITVFRYLAEVE